MLRIATPLVVRSFLSAFYSCPPTSNLYTASSVLHWPTLVKNIGLGNQNIGGEKVTKSDKCMSISQLLGTRAHWAAPYSLGLCRLGLPFVFFPETFPYITVPLAMSLLFLCVPSRGLRVQHLC